ncbi:type I-F CRISPR-associated protein Csy1 [Piscinibacter sakaiensis]|uniref:CRISPR-associated protein, Csy1 family n=1 Tax=Piscinibacter sakaiensis TaxID=1547922 RepID=A0A0K8P523_PISS1|nr:type I-F CRISPR-associated protein Csy1 [Piscinibacter sakaiensis]GAP37737.1 CRISPR-associated protein, Csy1 family [Piscinibacter sakaiensis]
MELPNALSPRSGAFRAAIVAFVDARREAKLKRDEKAGTAASRYDPDVWLADAARRAPQLQAATHVAKATHPDARGSNLHVAPDKLPQHAEIGSHSLGHAFAEDVVGAGALGVFKFLQLEVEGRRLLDWMLLGDEDLQHALHPDPAVARAWMAAFCALVREAGPPRSHGLAKQVYWLVGDDPSNDDDFHLLQPMFSSSLAQALHASVQEIFGDDAKAARQAKRDRAPHEGTFFEYRALAMRKLGGSKPQNISQLNSERGGNNLLLASLPPLWRELAGLSMFGQRSAIECLPRLAEVRTLLGRLVTCLRDAAGKTMETRIERERIERALGWQLPVFFEMVQARHEAGWTRSPLCELPLCEQLWLDPERTELPPREDSLEEDLAFNEAFASGHWADEVAERFSRWLNGSLRDHGITAVGDVEFRHWARQALVDVAWPMSMQRRASGKATA